MSHKKTSVNGANHTNGQASGTRAQAPVHFQLATELARLRDALLTLANNSDTEQREGYDAVVAKLDGAFDALWAITGDLVLMEIATGGEGVGL